MIHNIVCILLQDCGIVLHSVTKFEHSEVNEFVRLMSSLRVKEACRGLLILYRFCLASDWIDFFKYVLYLIKLPEEIVFEPESLYRLI